MSVSRRLRYEVLRRDDHACRYCGAKAPDVSLTVDHVIPSTLGGSDQPDNLVAACTQCNAGKAASNPDAPLVAGVTDDALRWGAAMRKAASSQRGRQYQEDYYVECFDIAWHDWSRGNEEVPRPPEWPDSIAHFYAVDIELETLLMAMNRAMRKSNIRGEHGEFKYMCGICWNILDERQRMASEMLAVED